MSSPGHGRRGRLSGRPAPRVRSGRSADVLAHGQPGGTQGARLHPFPCATLGQAVLAVILRPAPRDARRREGLALHGRVPGDGPDRRPPRSRRAFAAGHVGTAAAGSARRRRHGAGGEGGGAHRRHRGAARGERASRTNGSSVAAASPCIAGDRQHVSLQARARQDHARAGPSVGPQAVAGPLSSARPRRAEGGRRGSGLAATAPPPRGAPAVADCRCAARAGPVPSGAEATRTAPGADRVDPDEPKARVHAVRARRDPRSSRVARASRQERLAPNARPGSKAGEGRPVGRAAGPAARGRNRPSPGLPTGRPFSTTGCPRTRTVSGQPRTVRPA